VLFNGRIDCIKTSSKKGKYILYWMQGAFRTEFNHTLEFAKYLANIKKLPLKLLIVIDLSYKDANYRHFKFFIEGILDLTKKIEEQKIAYHIKIGNFSETVQRFLDDAEVLITDRSYLKFMQDIKKGIYEKTDTTSYEVDTNLLIPVKVASSKAEYGAYTIRPKIEKLQERFLNDFVKVEYFSDFYECENEIEGGPIDEILKNVQYLPPTSFKGGESEAERILNLFLTDKFHNFAVKRGDPAFDNESNLSFYLHFGFISPIKILKEAKKVNTTPDNYATLFEQLIVRRELAHNFTYYTQNIIDLNSFLPSWAKNTLQMHVLDKRNYIYKVEELENCNTHDIYWNAAQKELITKGKINNYMRMYWGKKVIEWSSSPETAYKNLIYLNDKYALDGRDPNGYAGIAWCFGMHDRAFKERPIFGKVRYMSASGLKSKFDMNKYIDRVENID